MQPFPGKNGSFVQYVRILRKCILVVLLMPWGIMSPAQQNDTDSLMYEDLQDLKKRVNLMLYRMNELKQKNPPELDSILYLSRQSLEEIESFRRTSLREHATTRDSLHQKASKLQAIVRENRKELASLSRIHFIFHGVAIALIILLILYIRAQRRKTMQYLIDKAKKLEGQNEEILWKANELEKIKAAIEKTRKQQKNLKKRMKKGK